ncbi:uncharacterized protein TrAtP1_007189 [Trichoderma atroviride]|uniref:uncharacterized protein n=1 Tax=Hypocrea atroviridis TaxID=63577 RepID=UPI00331B7FE0|nr:hypothetical protein TrAtP1_007189 [Trichoderma atroviride]
MAPSALTSTDNAVLLSNATNNTHRLWWRDPGLRSLDIILLSSFLDSMANGYDNSLISGLEAIPRWFDDISGAKNANTLGLLIAAYSRHHGHLDILWEPHIDNSWSWRTPVITQLFWTSVQPVFVLFTPESPRWLVNNQQPNKAKSILAKYHANGDETDELVIVEFSEICASVELAKSSKVTWASFFATPGNQRGVFICVGLGSRYAQGINRGLRIYNWFLSIAGAMLAEKVGRRRLFILSSSIMLLFMILILTCSAVFANTGNTSSGIAVIVFLFLFLGGYVIGFTPIPILYVNEIWPTELRAKGASVYWLSQTLAICFNQYVNPIALREIQWRYYFVYIGVLGIFDKEYAVAVSQPLSNALRKEETEVATVENAA